MSKQMLGLVIKHKGWKVAKLTTEADPDDPAELRQLLVEAVQRDGRDESQIGDYEMDVSYKDSWSLLQTYITSPR